jgi:hypothetical protein
MIVLVVTRVVAQYVILSCRLDEHWSDELKQFYHNIRFDNDNSNNGSGTPYPNYQGKVYFPDHSNDNEQHQHLLHQQQQQQHHHHQQQYYHRSFIQMRADSTTGLSATIGDGEKQRLFVPGQDSIQSNHNNGEYQLNHQPLPTPPPPQYMVHQQNKNGFQQNNNNNYHHHHHHHHRERQKRHQQPPPPPPLSYERGHNLQHSDGRLLQHDPQTKPKSTNHLHVCLPMGFGYNSTIKNCNKLDYKIKIRLTEH